VLGALARAGRLRVSEEKFEKDGKRIPFRKVSLASGAVEGAETEFVIKAAVRVAASRKKKGKKKAWAAPARTAASRAKGTAPEKEATRRKKTAPAKETATPAREAAAPRARKRPADDQASRIEEALRTWRLGEAKRRGVPAFRILTDSTLRALAEARPQTASALLAIPGIGIHTVEKYGAQLYRILAQQ
jgi:DNA topoisomerase-3